MSYLQNVREEDNRWKWKKTEGRKKTAIFGRLRKLTTVMGPVSTSPHTYHSDCSVRFRQYGKNPALRGEAVQSFTGFGRFSV